MQKLAVVCALITAVGGHWFILQSAAWVGMLVRYSENATFAEALVKTFDGRHLCRICKAVAEGKKSESGKTLVKFEIKLDYTLGAISPLLFPPQADANPALLNNLSPLPKASPPYPPPRLA